MTEEDLNIWLPTFSSVQNIFSFFFFSFFLVKKYLNSEKGNLWLDWFLPNFHNMPQNKHDSINPGIKNETKWFGK